MGWRWGGVGFYQVDKGGELDVAHKRKTGSAVYDDKQCIKRASVYASRLSKMPISAGNSNSAEEPRPNIIFV